MQNRIFLNVTWLKKLGYLDQIKTGILSWTDGSEIRCHSYPFNETITLKYTVEDKSFEYDIELMKQYIHLTNSYRNYLVCPITGKKAMKLYLYGGRFIHISKILECGCYYFNQTQSKHNRAIDSHHTNREKFEKYFDMQCEWYIPVHKTYNRKETKKSERMVRAGEKSRQQMLMFYATSSFMRGLT